MASDPPNFISIYDNTATANFVYLSESVTEATGWTPDELVGKKAYDLFHPDDIGSLTRIHAANVMNEKMSSMARYRSKHKDGHYVMLETVVHYCYDVIVCTNFIYDPQDIRHKIRSTSVDEVWVVDTNGALHLEGAWNDNQERMHKTLATANKWINNRVEHPQEPRFCLIINRYTYNYTIVFISQMAEKLVGAQCDQVLGRSLLELVSERDVDVVQAQLDMVKSSDMIMRMRFNWLMDSVNNTTEAVEAIASSSNDGITVVVRLAPRISVTQQE
ncbi:hypothetical protein LRAMOSA01627 [Lichtheimia ramosa]|uniref:PAS domain-containing protein n=1 Tax=Lichtheimia ramosa TaxID=688394 RepID=A0A077WKJ2_9FUNG|nr:hypothetical protein LRAMOSA01627 [Lichtheimia ramosa]